MRIASLLVVLATVTPAFASEGSPNILFIFADDWGWGDLGCHGHRQIKTPNLDRLAREGTDFHRFTVCNPVCSPSRTAIITGHFPARHRVHQHFASHRDNVARGMPDWLDPKLILLPRLLKQAGYTTGHFGKWHLSGGGLEDAPLPAAYGFDEAAVWTGPGKNVFEGTSVADKAGNAHDRVGASYLTEAAVEHTIRFIRSAGQKPFYVNLWIHETHHLVSATEADKQAYSDTAEPGRTYYAAVTRADRLIGTVLETLDELKFDKNTIVIFSSDNGPEETHPNPGDKFYYSVGSTGGLRGRKRSLYLGGVNTPLIVRWPGQVPAGRIDRTSVLSGVDILPTLLAAAKIPQPEGYQSDGVNALPAFRGENFNRSKSLFWEWRGNHAKPANWPELGMRDGKWGLLMTQDGKRVELYDLPSDRSQSTNVAEQQPEQVAAMIQTLTAWQATLPASPALQAVAIQPTQTNRSTPNRARAFARWDKNNDGMLTLEEYRKGLTKKTNVERRFENLDTDGNGKLSRAEFVGPDAVDAEVRLNGHNFRLPDGFTIEQVAGPPLVDRPISADFDQQGRLYVADSSGSNEPVEQQVKNPTHRIVRLEDADGDGRFDKSVVFADGMMFPEGTLWHQGSLYVAAPPSIWKLTDTNGDGVADQREEWFQGKTLTHCANDLHGPYLGPDGWFYWCKGAYAEQSYERPGKPPFVTKAAHIFRCRPDAPRDPQTGSVLTSAIEPVMTGGMANPVDVTFTSGGERIFTTTFLIRPQAGLRDGLIHAVYGGVYGQQRDSIDGHPRTGELMPVLLHTGAAAPCGLTRYESRVFGDGYQDNLFACLFNMHKVTRHVLEASGATFETKSEDFLVSDNLDFHPTDVLEDADGSLVVVDTGGWYKLCCPTSQLEKPDILGAIYRVRCAAASRVNDPRGLKQEWSQMAPAELASLLDDPRPAIQRRAMEELGDRGADAIPALRTAVAAGDGTAPKRRNAVWALTRIDHADAREAIRTAVRDRDETVRQTAIHSISVRRDCDAVADLIEVLKSDSSHNRRAAAEALGRIGNKAAVPPLLAAGGDVVDRVLEHSLIYALIEIADVEQTRTALASGNARSRRAALIALDQMNEGNIKPHEVVPLLTAHSGPLKAAADWIVDHHLDWGEALVPYFREQLRHVESSAAPNTDELESRLGRFAATEPVQRLLGESLEDRRLSQDARRLALRAMAQSDLKEVPSSWTAPLAHLLHQQDSSLTSDVVGVLLRVPVPKTGAEELVAALLRVAGHPDASPNLRLRALSSVRHRVPNLDGELFELVVQHVDGELPVDTRATAVEILAAARLDARQLTALAGRFAAVSPLDINRLLAAFDRSRDEGIGYALVESLKQSPARSALRIETLQQRMANYPSTVQQRAAELYALMEAETAEQRARLADALSSLPAGNVRRGQEVFHSAKAACAACHTIGYLGGRVGPDLTRIARTRTERDLLEAILFPSASLVQNYAPLTIVTQDGRVFNGLVQSETEDELVLATGPNKTERIERSEIEEMQRSKVSIMPAGLDKQLTPQQLADLVEFLKTRK